MSELTELAEIAFILRKADSTDFMSAGTLGGGVWIAGSRMFAPWIPNCR